MLDDLIKQAAEQLLGDESLTGDLDDSDASILINWGLKVSRLTCLQAAGMDQESATAFLDQPLYNLRRMLRRINRLAGQSMTQSAEENEGDLQKIFTHAAQIPVLSVPDNPPTGVGDLLASLPPADALPIILNYMSITEGDENGEEEKL